MCNNKYKTELCKNWLDNQYCRYGDRCMFAHGLHELNQAQEYRRAGRARPRLCMSFYNEGYCRFGDRCTFQHSKKGQSDEKISHSESLHRWKEQVLSS